MKSAASSLALWGGPTAVALVSAIGLVGGLRGDGAWDWLAWGGLGLPVALTLWYGLVRRQRDE